METMYSYRLILKEKRYSSLNANHFSHISGRYTTPDGCEYSLHVPTGIFHKKPVEALLFLRQRVVLVMIVISMCQAW